MQQYKIVIVDDHILIAKAMSVLIENFQHYSVLYEAENGKKLVEQFKVPKNIPDIVLLDISMPEMDGFETARWLKANHPEVLVVALSAQNDDQSLINMVKAGAKGYLVKNTHPTLLEKALDSLVANGYYYPDWAANKVFSSLSDNKAKQISFSDREIDFLKHCCSEMTYKEIAEKMYCSVHTVEGYRDNLFEKLGLKTRVGLAIYAIRNGKDQ
jgi:DNA-binding NarL/FixJ family response regulator